jgi:hypothetical protein
MKERLVAATLVVSVILTAIKVLWTTEANLGNKLAYVARWIVGENPDNHYPGKHRIVFDMRLFYSTRSISGHTFTFASVVM